MKRRTFIQKGSVVCLGSLAGGSILSACTKVYYAAFTTENNRISVAKTEFDGRDYVVIKDARLPAPIFIWKEGEDYSAVLMLCTHKACEVAPFGRELHCPCHGSEFTCKGKVITGPAEKDLEKFKVESDDQYIFIT